MTETTLAGTEMCRHCAAVPADFADDLGHDHLGHRTVSALMNAGIDTRERLAKATDAELIFVRNLGDLGRIRIRQVFPAPKLPAPRACYSPHTLLDRLPVGTDLPDWMVTESASAAPLWILTAMSRADQRIWRHVNTHGIKFAAILREGGWSPTERALLAAARSLSGTRAAVDLDELAVSLDSPRWDALMEALRIRRAGLRGA